MPHYKTQTADLSTADVSVSNETPCIFMQHSAPSHLLTIGAQESWIGGPLRDMSSYRAIPLEIKVKTKRLGKRKSSGKWQKEPVPTPSTSKLKFPIPSGETVEITRIFRALNSEVVYTFWCDHPDLHGFYPLVVDCYVDPITQREVKLYYGFYLAPGATKVSVNYQDLKAIPSCDTKAHKKHIFSISYTLATGEKAQSSHYLRLKHGSKWGSDQCFLDVCNAYLRPEQGAKYLPQIPFRHLGSNLTCSMFEQFKLLVTSGPYMTSRTLSFLTGISERRSHEIRDSLLLSKHTDLRVFFDTELSNLSLRVYPCECSTKPYLIANEADESKTSNDAKDTKDANDSKDVSDTKDTNDSKDANESNLHDYIGQMTYGDVVLNHCFIINDADAQTKALEALCEKSSSAYLEKVMQQPEDTDTPQQNLLTSPYATVSSYSYATIVADEETGSTAIYAASSAHLETPYKQTCSYSSADLEGVSVSDTQNLETKALSVASSFKLESYQQNWSAAIDLANFHKSSPDHQLQKLKPAKKRGRKAKKASTAEVVCCFADPHHGIEEDSCVSVSWTINDKVKENHFKFSELQDAPYSRGIVHLVFTIGDFKPVHVMVDEISIVGRTYITIFTGIDESGNVQIMYIADSNKKHVVTEFVTWLGKDLAQGVEVVSCDMNAGFSNAFMELMPHVLITFDAFHWVNHMNDGVIFAVSKVHTALKKAGQTSQEDLDALERHGIRLFLSKPSRLSEEDLNLRKHLATLHNVLSEIDLGTKAAHQALACFSSEEMEGHINEVIKHFECAGKHELFKRYKLPRLYKEKKPDVITARKDIRHKGRGLLTMSAQDNPTDADYVAAEKSQRKQRRQKVNPLLQVSAMLTTYKDGVITYAETQQTNGMIEGTNNLCKVIRRAIYGVKNVDRYKLLLKEQVMHLYHRTIPVCRPYLAAWAGAKQAGGDSECSAA